MLTLDDASMASPSVIPWNNRSAASGSAPVAKVHRHVAWRRQVRSLAAPCCAFEPDTPVDQHGHMQQRPRLAQG
jgi:hypothetical protein